MDAAAHAEAIVDAWHQRLIAGALPRPSPTIGTALAAGYAHLMVYCEGCRYSAHVPLRGFRRPVETQLIDLAPRLICERCGRRGPLPQIKGVARRVTPTATADRSP
jgi:hypothetical protein